MKCCTKLRVVYRRYFIVLQGNLSNSNDTRVKEITDLVPISTFLDNPSSNPKTELRNEAQRFDGQRRHARCFSLSSFNFQCRIGQTKSVSQLQLSNLSDLPCFTAHMPMTYGLTYLQHKCDVFRSHILFATHHPLCNTNGLIAGYCRCLQHIWQLSIVGHFCSSYAALQHKTPLCSTHDPLTSTQPLHRT